MNDDDDKPLTLLGIPVRLDSTLCDPDEIWLEGPTGEVVRVTPPVNDDDEEEK